MKVKLNEKNKMMETEFFTIYMISQDSFAIYTNSIEKTRIVKNTTYLEVLQLTAIMESKIRDLLKSCNFDYQTLQKIDSVEDIVGYQKVIIY